MKKMNFISFAILFSITSFAQTTKPPVKPAAPKCTYLEQALATAKKDLSDVNALIAIEKKKTDTYQTCTMNEYFARQKSADWFVSHYTEFDVLSHKIDSVLAEANTKISALTNESVSVIPVEKQGTSTAEVKVSLASMIKYFQVYNSRIKACQKDLQPELISQMEDPRRNDLNLAHSQVVAAMKMMTTNLNASLADTNTRYEITFVQGDCGYQLDLKVSLEFNGTKQEYKFSLLTLDAQAAKIALSDKAKWSALIAKDEMIAGYPIDAMKRLKIFIEEERGTCNSIPHISKKASSGSVFDTYANLTFVAKRDAKKITLANGKVVDCAALNGTFKTPQNNTIEITDACNSSTIFASGGSWEGHGEKPASWDEDGLHVTWQSEYFLLFTPRDVNTFDYTNVTKGGTNVFTRVK